jgi:hypothetical protein
MLASAHFLASGGHQQLRKVGSLGAGEPGVVAGAADQGEAVGAVGVRRLVRDGRVASVPTDQEVAVAVVIVFQGPGFTRESYEESVRRLTDGKSRLESPADWPVEGLLAHAAGEGEGGFRVVDVWESEEAFGRFGETLVPILRDMGVEGDPEVYPAHTFVSA